MKIVQRKGVFETNSSSTHTLILTTKDQWEKEAQTKYKKYRVLSSPLDKLNMACGCCHELFPSEERSEKLKEICARVREHLHDEDDIFLYPHALSCELAVKILTDVYCRKYGGDSEDLQMRINAINSSGRACHMEFFSEGALYDPSSDYGVIEDLFYDAIHSGMSGVYQKIADYFDENNVLVCREYYQGVGYDED